MTGISITNDRKQIVRALEKATGEHANYLGAPGFAYEIGPYTVDRNGTVFCEDPDPEVIDLLVAQELILPEETEDTRETIISLPLAGHDGRSLRNLVNMLHSKYKLMGKAVGRPGFYRVSEQLVLDLKDADPITTERFFEVLHAAGGNALRGLSFEEEKISLHYPYTADPDRIRTCMQLSECMVRAAGEQKRVQPKEGKCANEKYAFRVWLMRLGMQGAEYKTARRILLKNLNGHIAFRTKDQADRAREKIQQKRKEEKERAAELAFHRL